MSGLCMQLQVYATRCSSRMRLSNEWAVSKSRTWTRRTKSIQIKHGVLRILLPVPQPARSGSKRVNLTQRPQTLWPFTRNLCIRCSTATWQHLPDVRKQAVRPCKAMQRVKTRHARTCNVLNLEENIVLNGKDFHIYRHANCVRVVEDTSKQDQLKAAACATLPLHNALRSV